MRIGMAIQFAQFGQQLQGQLAGKRHYARTCELLSQAKPGELVMLDFQGVEVVTGSWLNAMIVPLYRWAADEQIDLFPVLCNPRHDWLDDLRLVAEWTHQCFLVANAKTTPRKAKLVGSLDPGQQTTLEAVLGLREVTGAELERERPDESVKATAWNNRLKDLHNKRLLRRTRKGREQLYSPV